MQLKTSDNGRGAAGSERAAAQIFDNMGLKDIFGRKRNLSAVEKEVEKEKLMALERDIIMALRQVYDPEIPVNIYDLGLIYELKVDEGHNVYVVADCCASRAQLNYETSLELMRQMSARITSLEMVLFEFLKSSKHPNFKEIQSLIK